MSVLDHPLHRLPKYGDGIGLHRVQWLMDALDIEATDVSRRAVAVTGSNGKGSTARIAAELLHAANGESVGLFTSPHLYRYNERFRIDGVPVDDAALAAAMDKVAEAVARYHDRYGDAVGAFEAQFVVALLLFRNCRWLVLEAGIGGRYDPVRLARAPVAALVSLDLEHTDLLGKTLVEIAGDKLDATAKGGTAFLGPSCLPLADQIRAYAALADIDVVFLGPEDNRDGGIHDGWQHFAIGELDTLKSRLVGRHQIDNHAVALALARARLARSGLRPDAPSALRQRWRTAIEIVAWPGRLETISHNPLVVVDVGHTPDGIKAALQGFEALRGNRSALLVTGGSKNKHVREMLEILVPQFDQVICTAAYHNGLAAGDVETMAKNIHPGAQISSCARIEGAVAAARHDARKQDAAVYVAGGLFLAVEFAHAWRGGDPKELRFF